MTASARCDPVVAIRDVYMCISSDFPPLFPVELWQPVFYPSNRAKVHCKPYSRCHDGRDRHAYADRHVYTVRKPVRVSRGESAAVRLPSISPPPPPLKGNYFLPPT